MKQITLIFIIACMSGCFGLEPQKTGKEGKPLLEFNLLLTDSITLIHSSDIPGGKPIILFYFNPHCPYCKAQTKEIIEDMDKLKDIHFYFMSNFPLREIKNFYKEYELAKYPNITIGLDKSNMVADYFEIAAVPFIAIYGKNKTLNKSFIGKIYSSQLKKVSEE